MSKGERTTKVNSVEAVLQGLEQHGYLTDSRVATVVFLALKLGKPLLVEGPAGVGKTELAKVLARMQGNALVRLQCYEGLDEAKALYEWDYRQQLLYLQAGHAKDNGWEQTRASLYTREFLLARPLLAALTSQEPVTLLIDEIDKSDEELESMLLEALSDFQVTIPEIGTITASSQPTVVLTSNNQRELSDALKRRCLHLYLTYPTLERELEIVYLKVPGIEAQLARYAVRVVQAVRQVSQLKKAPSVAETLDWARALVELGVVRLDRLVAEQTLPVLLKYQEDLELVRSKLGTLLPAGGGQ